jgi:hypothetical protein
MKYIVKVFQNGGEYIGKYRIAANLVKKVNSTSINADGVLIDFDDLVDEIIRVN